MSAKDALTNVKKDNEVLMNSIPQIHREIMDRKKLSTQDQKEIEELEIERNNIYKELGKFETQFKLYNEKLNKKEKEISANEEKINEGNDTIENLKK